MDVGFLVFMLSLGVLVLLKPSQRPQQSTAPRHLHLRIGTLGLCLGGLAHYFTARLPVALGTAVVVWAPLPIIKWWRVRQDRQAAATRKPPPVFKQVFRPMPPLMAQHDVCTPCTKCKIK